MPESPSSTLTSPGRPPGPGPNELAADAKEIQISPRRVCTVLGIVAAGLIAAGIVSDVLHHVLGHPWAFGFVPYFDLNLSHAVPSFVAAIFIAVLAVSLLVAGRAAVAGGEPMARAWYLLGGVAAFMSLDEGVGLHELVRRPGRDSLTDPGVLAAIGLVLAVIVFAGLLCRRFVATLPGSARRPLLAGAALYLLGAFFVDLLSGAYASQNGLENIGYGLIVAVEEGLELAGLIVALYGVLVFLRERRAAFRVWVR